MLFCLCIGLAPSVDRLDPKALLGKRAGASRPAAGVCAAKRIGAGACPKPDCIYDVGLFETHSIFLCGTQGDPMHCTTNP